MAAGSALMAQTPAKRASKPNILFLMTDQHRFDCLGASGNKLIHTPNLDRLAAEGVRFTNAYSSTPSCTPARTALLTGLSPWHHGMLGYSEIAQRYPFEKPRAMREAGYHTITVGKNHYAPIRNGHGYRQMLLDEHCPCGNGNAPWPNERTDYESWFYSEAPSLDPHATKLWWNDYPSRPFALPERLHPTKWTGDTAVRFLDAWQGPEPFFMKVSFIRPHSPYDPPERFMKMYAEAAIPTAQVGRWAARHATRNSNRNDIWRGRLSEAEIRNMRQGYYGCISQIDEQVGRILETLEKKRLLEETLIVFTSDHGDMSGDNNLWRKSYAYEASAHIPMLMRWPQGMLGGVRRGTSMPQPVELRDLLPTFLDAAGAEAPRPLDGKSLLGLVNSGGAGWREFIDLEHDVTYSKENHWNALTDGHTKYIYHARDGEEQLFHLAGDPHELTDLAGDAAHAGELRTWRHRLVAHFQERGEPFLRSGSLAPRPESLLKSPLFPHSTTN